MLLWEEFLRVDGWRSDYPSVDVALRHYGRRVGSEKTRANFSGNLMRFCKYCSMGPEELVGREVDEVSRLCQDFTDDMKDRDYSIRYVNVCQTYLRTFFKLNGFMGNRALRVERYYQPTRYRKKPEYIPKPEEIYRMGYASGSSKNRALIYAIFSSGLRNSTVRAIRYGDVRKELENGLEVVKIQVYPKMKEIDPKACKGNIPYYTFIDAEAVRTLHGYLGERRQRFGEISDNEPLFCSDSNNLPPEKQRITPVSSTGLQGMIKIAAKQAGIERWDDVTPHCLRKAFETALRNNRLDPKDQGFLMGHTLPGSQDAYYNSTKIDDLRKKYRQIEFFQQRVSVEELRKKQVLDTVKLLGFSDDRIKRVEEALAKYEAVDDAMEEIRKLSLESYKLTENPNNDPKKVVNESELESYLVEGWDVQNILPSGRILIKKSM